MIVVSLKASAKENAKGPKMNNDLSKGSCVTDAGHDYCTKESMFRIFVANALMVTIVSLLA